MIEPAAVENLDSGFQVELLFPDEYSEFIAEVYYKDRLVFVINQEKRLDKAEIEFAADVRGFPERMSLQGLQKAIDYARKRLSELRETV